MYNRKCPLCGKELTYKQKGEVSRANRANGKCASCAAFDKPRTGLHTTCAGCGKSIYKPRSEIRPRNFCSRKCLNSIKGENSPAWNGGRAASQLRENIRVQGNSEKTKTSRNKIPRRKM